MYPLSILLGIAAFYEDAKIKMYVLPLAIIGISISAFHYLEQKVPGFAAIKPCSNGVPCNVEYINWLGFITIPFLAFTAFLLIIVFMVVMKPKNQIDQLVEIPTSTTTNRL
jgi:disulfide bond formation protein DsbB